VSAGPDRYQTATTPKVARSEQDVAALRPLWEALSPANVDADIDYVLTVVRNHAPTISPFTLRVDRPDGEPMLVVARLDDYAYPVKVGYRELFRFRLRTIVVAFDGILGAESEADQRRCVEELLATVRRGDADAVIFQKLEVGSPLQRVVANQKGLAAVRGVESSTQWLIDLPDSLDEFLARRSTSTRQRIRTDNRKLVRKYDDVKVVRLDLLEPEAMLAELEKVSRKAYQRALGVGATNTELGRALILGSQRQGWLRAWMLYLDGIPVAFWLGTLYRGVFTIDSPSFDPAYAKDSVGMYSMFAMVEDLCADPAAEVLNLGHGDAEYKRRHATRTTQVRDEILLARRLRPLAVGWMLRAVFWARRTAYRVLARDGYVDRLRKSSRARLAQRNTDG
jgi:hypothetical protein